MPPSKRILKRMAGFFRKAAVEAPPPARWPAPAAAPSPAGYFGPTGAAPPADLPFCVSRTPKSGELPVYRDYKNGRTKVVTLLRRVDGDASAAAAELRAATASDVRVLNGRIEIAGDHKTAVQAWLAGLGF